MEKKKSRLKFSLLNMITGFGGSILTTVLNFAVRTVFIYTLGKAYLGINGLFSDIFTMLSLTELGFGTAITFRMYKPLAEKDARTVRMLVRFYKQAYRIVGAAITVLGILLIPALRFLISDYDSLEGLGINAVFLFLLYLFQCVSSYLFFAYRGTVIRADQKEYITNVANYVSTLIGYIVRIIVLVVWRDFILYTVVVILTGILNNLVIAVIAKRMYPDFFTGEADSLPRSELASMLKDTGALFIYKINDVVLKSTDNLVLSAMLGLSAVGLYSNYLMLYRTITTFLERFYSSCRASIGNIYATEGIERSYFIFEVMNFLVFILYGTGCVGVAVVANEFIMLWIGPEYLVPQPFPLLIGIEILLVGIKYAMGQMRNIAGTFKQMWYRPILSMSVNLLVSIGLAKVMGIYGVILGTICSDASTNLMIDPTIIHRHSFHGYRPVGRYYRKLALYSAVLAGTGIADYFLCQSILTGRGIWSLLCHMLICACSVPLVFLCLFRNSEVVRYLLGKARPLLDRALHRMRLGRGK